MGFYISRFLNLFEGFNDGKPAKIVMVGLDAAGKTTILYKVKLNQNITTLPTIGFNVETVQPTKGVTFTVWDVGGQEKIRRLWKNYYKDAAGLLFVVDSSDRMRIDEAKQELNSVIKNDEMNGVPFVLIANKQDLPGAMCPNELITHLSLKDIKDRKWRVQGTCAIHGEGLYESMEHLTKLVREFKS